MSERGPAERRNAYERACADLLMRLGDWRTMRDLGALPGQLASLKAAEGFDPPGECEFPLCARMKPCCKSPEANR